MIGMYVQPQKIRESNMIKAAFNLVRALCAGILGLALGFLLADEVSQRMVRAELRDACKSQYNAQIPPELQEGLANMVEFKCRSAIP
jgi:hypothetical protein